MKKLMLGVALMGGAACGSAPQRVYVGTTTTPESTTTAPEATTTTEAPTPETTTTEAPATTVTTYDWGPVLCPSLQHPAHHSPCPAARPAPATTIYEAVPSPQGRTASGSTPPEYVKQCESGGSYTAVNPNGHYGAWQFSQSTWESVGGTGRPDHATPAEQDYRASILWDNGRGASHWECA